MKGFNRASKLPKKLHTWNMPTVPQTANLTELQRQPRRVIQRMGKTKKPIFITDRSRVSAVMMGVDFYDKLLKNIQNKEDDFWLGAMEESLNFWEHSSNDVYEKLL